VAVGDCMERREIAAYLIIAAFGAVWVYYATQPNLGFGDETYYILAARAYIANNFIPATHIPNLYDTPLGGEPLAKPPLSYYIPALFLFLDDYYLGNLFVYKLFPPIFCILTLVLIYMMVGRLFNRDVALLSIILFASVPLITHFTIITYFDIPYTFFYTLAVLKLYEMFRNPNTKNIIYSGTVVGITFLCKESALFIIPSLFAYLFMRNGFNLVKMVKDINFKSVVIVSLIGLCIIVPWWVRNYILFGNPVYPFFPNIFGWKYLDKFVYKQRMELTAIPLVELINYWTLESYLGFAVLVAGLFGIIYLFLKKNYYFVSIILVGLLPFLTVGAKDIRYIMFLIPSICIAASISLYDLLKNVKYKHVYLILLCILIILSMKTVVSESERITKNIRGFPPGTIEAYLWIRENTPKDSVVMDLFTPNMVFVTGRKGVFPHICCCGDLWEFWKLPEDEMIKVLKKYDIKYIVTENYFYTVPKWKRHLLGWTHIPEEFVYLTNSSKHFKLVYNTKDVFIFEVMYNA